MDRLTNERLIADGYYLYILDETPEVMYFRSGSQLMRYLNEDVCPKTEITFKKLMNGFCQGNLYIRLFHGPNVNAKFYELLDVIKIEDCFGNDVCVSKALKTAENQMDIEEIIDAFNDSF